MNNMDLNDSSSISESRNGQYMYVVTYGQNAKKIFCHFKTKECILKEFKNTFKMHCEDVENLLIQTFDKDFDMYIDVDDFDDLPDKGRLKVFKQDCGIEDSIEKKDFAKSDDQHVIHDKGKQFPHIYQLPSFPVFVNSTLAKNPETVAKSSRLRKMIVNTLADDAMLYRDGYLSSREYVEICCALINTYPDLSDKKLASTSSTVNMSAYATWLYSLRGRIKYLRRKQIVTTDMMVKMQQKYGHRHPKTSIVGESVEASKIERTYMRVQVHNVEDSKSIQIHKNTIIKEWLKKQPNLTIIDDRMERTATERVLLYKENVENVLAEYSLLQDSKELIKDCKRIFKIDVTKSQQDFFSERTVKILIEQLSKYPKAKDILEMGKCFDSEKTAVLLLLPLLFKENLDDWQVIDKNVSTCHPIIRLSTANRDMFSPEMIDVFVNKKIVCSNSLYVATAFEALISCIYLWNFEFNPKTKKNF